MLTPEKKTSEVTADKLLYLHFETFNVFSAKTSNFLQEEEEQCDILDVKSLRLQVTTEAPLTVFVLSAFDVLLLCYTMKCLKTEEKCLVLHRTDENPERNFNR